MIYEDEEVEQAVYIREWGVVCCLSIVMAESHVEKDDGG